MLTPSEVEAYDIKLTDVAEMVLCVPTGREQRGDNTDNHRNGMTDEEGGSRCKVY